MCKFFTINQIKVFILLITLSAFFLVSCGGTSNRENSPLNMENAKPANMGNSIENLNNGGFVTNDNTHIYYVAGDENGNPVLYKTDLNGKNKTILLHGFASYLNVIGDWVYYIDYYGDNNIYRIRSTDGGECQKLTDMNAVYFLVYKDRLYAISYFDDGNRLYSMNIDGTDVQCLSDDEVAGFYIYEDSIYMSSSSGSDEKGHFSKMRLDGSNKERIFDYGLTGWFRVYGDYIYYLGEYKLYKVDIYGNNQSEIVSYGEFLPDTFNFNNKTFYYSTLEDSFLGSKTILHWVDVDTGEAQNRNIPRQKRGGAFSKIYDYIIGDKIFRQEKGELFVMDLDGSNIRPWGD